MKNFEARLSKLESAIAELKDGKKDMARIPSGPIAGALGSPGIGETEGGTGKTDDGKAKKHGLLIALLKARKK